MLTRNTFEKMIVIPAAAMRVLSRVAGSAAATYLLGPFAFPTNLTAPLTSPYTEAGAVDSLTVVDSGTNIRVASTALALTGNATYTGNYVRATSSIARATGRVLALTVAESASIIFIAGWSDRTALNDREWYGFKGLFTAASAMAAAGANPALLAIAIPANTPWSVYIILRSAGYFMVVDTGSGKVLHWVTTVGTATPLWPGVDINTAAQTASFDNLRVIDLPTPWNSDYGIASFRVATPSAITPTAGSELMTDGGLENWTTATNATSWVEALAGTSTVNQETTIVHGGSSAARLDLDASNSNSNIAQTLTSSIDTWLQMTYWLRTSASGKTALFAPTNVTALGGVARNPGTTWTQYRETGLTLTGSPKMVFQRSSAASASIYVDDVSVTPLNLASMMGNINTGPTDYIAEVAPTLDAGTLAGMVLSLDNATTPANFILALHNGVDASLWKCVAGAYTNVIQVTATYVAGARLMVIKEGSNVSLYYNNVKMGSTSTISNVGIISNVLAGVFSSYSGNTFGGGGLVVYPRALSGAAASTLAAI